jgi:hypothetical protein
MANSILVPKARGRGHEEQKMELLGKVLNDSTNEDYEEMFDTESTACLPWRSLGGKDRFSLMRLTLEEAESNDGRLESLGRCYAFMGLWIYSTTKGIISIVLHSLVYFTDRSVIVDFLSYILYYH